MAVRKDVEINSLLNSLLVSLHRSLAQYVLDAWLWSTSDDGKLKGAILSLVERQREDVGKIADLLIKRRHPINFGNYPVEWTRVNYLAIEYLYSYLCDQQHLLVQQFEQAISKLNEDQDARVLVQEVLQSQKTGLNQLWNVELPGDPDHITWMK